MIAGMLIGSEREHHGRPAGFRTTTMVCAAAALAMVISQVAFADTVTTSSSWRPDPMRLAAGVLTGMGFLGAGTIIRNDNHVRGITTAATLWISTMLGLCFGAGLFFAGTVGLIAVLAILLLLPRVEARISQNLYARLTITMDLTTMSEQDLKEILSSLGTVIRSMDLYYDFVKRSKTVSCELRLKKPEEFSLGQKLTAMLSRHAGIHSVAFKC